MEADFQYVGWKSYDQLKLDLPVGPSVTVAPGVTLGRYQAPSTLVKNWADGYMIRVGGEYRMDGLALRAGFIYDKTPQPEAAAEPMLPDANRVEGSLGLSNQISNNVAIHAAYVYIAFSDGNGTISYRTALPTTVIPATVIAGTYTNSASLFGVNLGLNF